MMHLFWISTYITQVTSSGIRAVEMSKILQQSDEI